MPYVAVPLYLLFGSRKLRMRDAPLPLPPVAPARADDDEAASLWARRLGRSMGLAPAAPYEALRMHADGSEARRAALEVIDARRARSTSAPSSSPATGSATRSRRRCATRPSTACACAS